MLKTLATSSAAVALTTTGTLAFDGQFIGVDEGQTNGKLQELIADLNAVEAELIAKMEETDTYLGSGRSAPDHVWAAQFSVGDRLDAAALAICAYCPANKAEQVAKSEWLLNKWWRDTQPEYHEVEALLRSMMEKAA